ncbi:hypothetical protein SDC9_187064 [bioreactor metagenome]|uniref:Uncharacterized protein n=1 Tax=bioreactor metagenome TaxID=1076179 RepID=A0A645HLX3_9ZZZZ
MAVIPNPNNNPKIGYLPKVSNTLVNPAYSDNGLTASFIKSIPVNRIPNPIKTSAICLVFGFPPNK